MSNIKFMMVGTERTGKYVGLATNLGQVGFRNLGDGTFRVRVEPVAGKEEQLAPLFPGWKTGFGGSEYRYSTVTHGGLTPLRTALNQALVAVLTEGDVQDVSAGCPDWLVQMAKAAKSAPAPVVPESETQERARLIAAIKAAKVPGCNFASRWTLSTLREKSGQ